MRIAHVTATFPPYRAGTGNVCYYNARELSRRGHSVHVLTAAVPGAAPHEQFDGVWVRRLTPLVRVGNAPVLLGLPGALRGFDVIHLHYPFIAGAELVRASAAILGSPFVLSFHNDLIGVGARAAVFTLIQWLSARFVVSRAAAVCAVSLDHFKASKLRHLLPDRAGWVVEVPNGVDVEHFTPNGKRIDPHQCYGIPEGAKLVLFVAALDRAHHFKGLSTLLHAMRRISKDTWLLVVGDGDLRATYEAEAVRIGVRDRTIFAGGVDHHETPAYFRGADVTVLPSTPPESFGLVLIESLACGTPVVASNIPGVRTVVEPGGDGLLTEPGNATALASAIAQIVADRDVGRAMGMAGRAKVVRRYSWERIGEQLESLYRQVVIKPKHRLVTTIGGPQ